MAKSKGWLPHFGLLVALAALTSCGGSGAPASPAGNNGAEAPSLSELEHLLQSEFRRLGVDPARVVARAPDGPANRVLDLQLDNVDADGPGLGSALPSAVQLNWTERFVGDFNQDGTVGVQDLASIGQNFRRSISYDDPALHGGIEHWPSGDPGGLGAPNWRLARVDGIADGVISVNDLTAIGLHYGERMDGYVIRHGINRGNGVIEWDSQPLDLGHGILPSLARPLILPAAGEPFRYLVQIPLADAQFNQYFTIQACDSASQTFGPESEPIGYSPNPGVDTEAPVWLDTIGLTRLVPGDEQMTLHFGTATDAQSPPVRYRVYYALGAADDPLAPFDFESADMIEVSQSPALITGLNNMDYWRAVVRAVDSAPQANEESNIVVHGVRIGAADVYPPQWQGQPGLLDLYYGYGTALLVCNTAIDSQQDEYGLWESGPVVYRVYHGAGDTPDFKTAQVLDFSERPLAQCVLPVSGIDTSKDHWFCVRVRDSAETANEDPNSVCLVGRALSSSTFPAPLGGPGVPDDAVASGPESFAFAPGQQEFRLVTQSQSDTMHYASSWILGGQGYEYVTDMTLASSSEAPDFSLQAAALDLQGQLRLLYIKESVFSDHFTISEFRQSLGQSADYTMAGDYEVNFCGYNANAEPFCIFDAFETSVASGLTDFRFYYSGLPLTSNNLIHDTRTGTGPQVVNLWDWGYSRLGDGRIGLMLRITDYISGAAAYKLLLCSGSGHSMEDYLLQADRLVTLAGNGVPDPLVITESSSAEGKTQHLGDGRSNLSVGSLPGMLVRRSQMHAASLAEYLVVLELESSCYYGAGNELRLAAVLLNGPQGQQKVPLLLTSAATSFQPLAALGDATFILTYYVPQNGDISGGDRHLVLRFD